MFGHRQFLALVFFCSNHCKMGEKPCMILIALKGCFRIDFYDGILQKDKILLSTFTTNQACIVHDDCLQMKTVILLVMYFRMLSSLYYYWYQLFDCLVAQKNVSYLENAFEWKKGFTESWNSSNITFTIASLQYSMYAIW